VLDVEAEELAPGLVGLSLEDEEAREVEARLVGGRIDGEGRAVGRERVLEEPAPLEDDTEVGAGDGEVGVVGDGPPEAGLGLVDLAAREVDDAEVHARLRESRAIFQRELEVGLGLVEAPFAEEPDALVVVTERVVGDARMVETAGEEREDGEQTERHTDPSDGGASGCVGRRHFSGRHGGDTDVTALEGRAAGEETRATSASYERTCRSASRTSSTNTLP